MCVRYYVVSLLARIRGRKHGSLTFELKFSRFQRVCGYDSSFVLTVVDRVDDNALEFGSEVGHYVTFINLNDEQWLVLDCDKFYIVPDGYAYHFAKTGRMFAYEENSIEDTNESTKNLNDYYIGKIDLIFK